MHSHAGSPKRSPQPVRKLFEIATRDAGILERLLFLLTERNKVRLPDHAGLNASRYGLICAQSRVTLRSVRQHGDRRESP